jgi:hypothetical protein
MKHLDRALLYGLCLATVIIGAGVVYCIAELYRIFALLH